MSSEHFRIISKLQHLTTATIDFDPLITAEDIIHFAKQSDKFLKLELLFKLNELEDLEYLILFIRMEKTEQNELLKTNL